MVNGYYTYYSHHNFGKTLQIVKFFLAKLQINQVMAQIPYQKVKTPQIFK
jgi:hypothetical protein